VRWKHNKQRKNNERKQTYRPNDRLATNGQVELLERFIVGESVQLFRFQNNAVAIKEQRKLGAARRRRKGQAHGMTS